MLKRNSSSDLDIHCLNGSKPSRGRPATVPPSARDSFPTASKSGFGRGRGLTAHLLHELPHRRDMTRITPFRPRFISLRRLLQMGQDQLVGKTVAEGRHYRLYRFPNAEEFTAGLKEEILV